MGVSLLSVLLLLIMLIHCGQSEEQLKPTVRVNPQTTVYTGDTLTLTCDLNTSPTGWTFYWYKNNGHFLPSTDFKDNNTLSITASDTAQYQCLARRGVNYNTDRSDPVTITVEKPKPTLRVNTHTTVYTGDTLILTCDLNISPTGWKFMWFRVSQQLQQLTPEYKDTNTLSITASDTAEYRCLARRGENIYTDYSDPVKITVKERPKATVKVQPADRVFIGERVTLTCDIESGDDCNYEWFKNNNPLSEAQWRKKDVISNVGGSDEGDYSCKGRRLTEPSYSEISAAVRLTVSALPKPKLTSSLTGSALRGSSVTLKCELDQSAGWEVYWVKDTQSNQIEASTKTHSFTISSVSDSDRGQYWCRAGIRDIVTHFSDAFWVKVTESPKPVVSVTPDKDVFRGETVTLRCDMQSGGDTEWKYSWFKNGQTLHLTSQEYRFTPDTVHDSGKFTCRGERKRDSQLSEISDALTLTVFGEAQAVLSVSPQSWLTEGDSVTLSCEARHSSTGWTFSWFRDGEELVSDSRREAGGSYTLSPAALDHTGVYECRATRGEPAFHTQTSNPQPLWITASSPPVSLMVYPSRTQHFIRAPLSLSCGGQSDSTGWRVRRYTHSGKVSDCTSVWGSVTGSTCKISSLSISHTGVYWCQSGSGGRSHPAIITVNNGAVILDSPVHAVSEGDPLTLHCLYRLKPSILTADFYKDGSFLQTQPAGEMTIPAASKTHEGLYHCKHPEKGESPTSWISVRVLSSSEAPFSVLCLLSSLVAASPYLLATIILVVKCYRTRAEPDEVNRT